MICANNVLPTYIAVSHSQKQADCMIYALTFKSGTLFDRLEQANYLALRVLKPFLTGH
jgi:hypothetical protein